MSEDERGEYGSGSSEVELADGTVLAVQYHPAPVTLLRYKPLKRYQVCTTLGFSICKDLVYAKTWYEVCTTLGLLTYKDSGLMRVF